jgi:DNA-binding NtrC family response regulator
VSAIRLILVEDEAALRNVLARELADAGFEVRGFASAEGVTDVCLEFQPSVALVDLRLPGKGGMDLLRDLHQLCADLQVVVLTGHGGVAEAVQAMRLGAYDFLVKPTKLEVLEQTLRRAAEKSDLLLENRRLRRAAAAGAGAHEILGDSPAMRELGRLIARIGPTDVPVLIHGENGTGKELIARNLHDLSPRATAAFVVLNCGAVASELVESELFGHERGAFTGAERQRIGLFEAADGGTLLLDEVGELPPTVQPALLRAVQFGEIRPVGSARARTVDVRVLAATNRDLVQEIAAGRFREDLFHRLATFHLEAPPLRERREDVAQLARTFLARATLKSQRTLVLDDAAVERLAAHHWSGNVRELENAMTRLAVLAPGEVVTAADVESIALSQSLPDRTALPTLRLDELERMAVRTALERHRGDKRAAARELGVSLRTLYNKLGP